MQLYINGIDCEICTYCGKYKTVCGQYVSFDELDNIGQMHIFKNKEINI